MSSIRVNTELLKNNNDTLDSIKKYYSDKKSSFSSGNFNGNSTINNYLNKIQSSYSEIANNINEVSKYLKDYYEDIENMENIMSGNGGSVKASGVNGIINGKASSLNKLSIEDGIIFEIIEFSTEGYKANINTESAMNNGESSSSSQEKINQTSTPTLESVVADQIGSGGMVFDFISGDFVPTGASVTSANYSLEAYDELANLYSEMGFSDSEVEELMACLNDEESFMNKILEIENRKLSDPEQRRVIYENNILADYAEFFQTTYGEEFSSLEELKAAIERENLKIEELKGKQQANLFTSDVLSTLLSRSNEAVKSLTGDTTVVWAFLGDDGLVHYSFMDPSQFMVVSNGVMENANLDEFKGKNMYNPKAYTLDEILSMCDSDVAASFRSLLAGNEINEDAKNEVITKLSSIQDDILKEVEKRNTYQQIYDEVTSTIDYQLNYIDEYTYNEDFANNIEVSPEAIDKVKEVINGLINSSQIDGVSGEKYIEMSSNDIDGISTLLYAYYNDLGNVTYDGNFFYINGTRINTLNFNLTAMDFAKYKPYMNESEKEVLNYIYNTEGEEALFEWLKNIGNEVDSRYLSAEEAKDEAFAQEHNILGTIASFDYSDAIVGTLKSIWATVTNQGIKDSYTYDSSSTYRNVVGSCLGDKYGSWATKAFNIGTTAFDQLIWAPVHVLSGGTTAALPAMFLASRSVCSGIGEAKARGFSDWESLVSGGAKGLITFLTEHASASHLFKLDKIAEEKIAPFLYEAFGDHKFLGKTIGTAFALNSQSVFEVEEEELEEILGNIVDEGLSNVFGLPSQSELDYQALLDIYPPEVAKTKYREAELNKYWDIAVDTYLSTLLSTGGYMSLNTAYENSNRHDAKKLAALIEERKDFENNAPIYSVKLTDAIIDTAERLFGGKEYETSSVRLSDVLGNTLELDFTSLFDKLFKQKSGNNQVSVNVSTTNLTQVQQDWVNRVNKQISSGKIVTVNLKDTRSVTSDMLAQIGDLSKVSIRMDMPLSDFDGNYMSKYQSEKYNNRVTYTGYEAYEILKKLEEFESKIDKNLPITLRAKQIYDLLASEVPVMRGNNKTANDWLVCQSLRGITANNIIGKAGLVCAGYSSAFRTLCDRCGIKSDYIRGQAVVDLITGKPAGAHAWNVFIDENNNPIPVDVTWKASGDNEWFGGSEKFQQMHVPDSDEMFKDYKTPANINDSIGIIENIIATMDQYYGDGSGLKALQNYYQTGNEAKITRQNGARDSLSLLTREQIKNYLDGTVTTVNKVAVIENIIATMDQYYGVGSGLKALQNYYQTGNENLITRKNGARDSLGELSSQDILDYLDASNNVSVEANTKTKTIIENIIATMDQYYGDGSGLKALQNYYKTGNENLITRKNGARDSLGDLSLDAIKNYLDTVVQNSSSISQKNSPNSHVDVEEVIPMDATMPKINQDNLSDINAEVKDNSTKEHVRGEKFGKEIDSKYGEKFASWYEGLSEDVRNALLGYSGAYLWNKGIDFGIINNYMRGKLFDNKGNIIYDVGTGRNVMAVEDYLSKYGYRSLDEFVSVLGEVCDNIKSACNLHFDEPTKLYRAAGKGFALNFIDFLPAGKSLEMYLSEHNESLVSFLRNQIGKTFVDNGFVSTATMVNDANNANFFSVKDVILEYNVDTDVAFAPLGVFNGEAEILLDSSQGFIIEDVYKSGNEIIVKLKSAPVQVQQESYATRITASLEEGNITDVIKEWKKYNSQKLPEGVHSKIDLDNYLVDSLIQSGALGKLTTDEFFDLLGDSYVIQKLMNTSEFTSFIDNQLKTNADKFILYLSNYDTKFIADFFNSSSINALINNLSSSKAFSVCDEIFKYCPEIIVKSPIFTEKIMALDNDNLEYFIDRNKYALRNMLVNNVYIGGDFLDDLLRRCNKVDTPLLEDLEIAIEDVLSIIKGNSNYQRQQVRFENLLSDFKEYQRSQRNNNSYDYSGEKVEYLAPDSNVGYNDYKEIL